MAERPDGGLAPFLDRLGGELVDAAQRRKDRRDRRRRFVRRAAVYVGALILAGLIPTLVSQGIGGSGTDDRALAIDREEGVVRARIREPVDPEAIERRLREAGIDAEVELVPVSPSAVGTWVGAEGEGDLVRETVWEEDVLIVPVQPGRLILRIGREARPGEDYFATRSAFLSGEPLHCSGIEELPLDQIPARLDEIGVTASWRVMPDTPDEDGAVGMTEVRETPPAEGRIIGAVPMSPDEVVIFVSLDPSAGRRIPIQYCD